MLIPIVSSSGLMKQEHLYMKHLNHSVSMLTSLIYSFIANLWVFANLFSFFLLGGGGGGTLFVYALMTICIFMSKSVMSHAVGSDATLWLIRA